MTIETMKYYDPIKNWKRLEIHTNDPVVRAQLAEDFSKYVEGRYGEFGIAYDPINKPWPRSYESCCWDEDHRGRRPGFWKLVKHAACHWLVNTGLLLAQRVSPQREWRIVSSDLHSTVWDGKQTLFDLNFRALGICPDKALEMALVDGVILEPGEMLETGIAS